MRNVIAPLVMAVALVACDVVTSRYATMEEARDDRVFERGWLPDILPASAVDIKVSSDLDVNTAEGHFRFSPSEAASFKQRTKAGAPDVAPLREWALERGKKRQRGFSEATYQSDRSTWVFFCKFEEGRCEYAMWLSRG